MIAVSIKTFLRDNCLYRLVASIKKYIPEARIYIADDGKMTNEKKEYYKKLEEEGHKIILMPFDTGLGNGRNSIVDEIEEKYYISCDDDFEFTERPDIEWCIDLLESQPKLLLVAGKAKDKRRIGIKEWGYNIEIKDKILYQHFNESGIHRHKGRDYKYADFVNNYFIAKTDIIRQIRWEDTQRIGYEHIDFALRVKKSGYKMAIAPSITVEHKNETYPEYEKYRKNYNTKSLFEHWDLEKAYYPFDPIKKRRLEFINIYRGEKE